MERLTHMGRSGPQGKVSSQRVGVHRVCAGLASPQTCVSSISESSALEESHRRPLLLASLPMGL